MANVQFDPSGGSEDPNPGPTKPKGTPPGPPKTKSLAGSSTNDAPDIFADYSGPEVDAAKTLIKNEMALLGWPQNVDANQMALYLLKNGLENKPQEAYESLWNSTFLTDAMRESNPNARFGQDLTTYHQNLAVAQDAIFKLTGMNVDVGSMLPSSSSSQMAGTPGQPLAKPGPEDQQQAAAMQDLLQSAIKNGWSQGQMMDYLQAGSFTDLSGKSIDLSAITAAQPWLLTGQGYQAEAQQFRNIYGAAPVDTTQLASWFRFNQGAAQMGPWYARSAQTAQATTPQNIVQTEVR